MVFYILHVQTPKPHKKKLSIVVLNMQKDAWNIINLYQVWNIETLQVMEP
jgi:hypothetical protein